MIAPRDILHLAWLKYRQKKKRLLLTSSVIAISISIIATVFISSSGFISLLTKATKDSQNDWNLATELITLGPLPSGEMLTAFPTPEEYRKVNEQYKITQIDTSVLVNVNEENSIISNWITEQSNEPGSYSIGYGIRTINETFATSVFYVDEKFLSDYIFEGYSMDDNYKGKIPVVLPAGLLTGHRLEGSISKKYQTLSQRINEVKGKTFTIDILKLRSEEVPPYGVKLIDSMATKPEIIVVGVVPEGPLLSNKLPSSHSISLPLWAYNQISSDELNSAVTSQTYFVQLSTKAERDLFAEEFGRSLGGEYSGYRQSIQSQLEELSEPIHWFTLIGSAVGLFLLVMSSFLVMFVLGKMIDDSRKEIGIFRAVGASQKDIVNIVISYSVVILLTGYLLGVLVSLIFCTLISLVWGDEIFYSVVLFSTNYSYSKPFLVLVGFPLAQLTVLFSITILSGVFASVIPARRAAKLDPSTILRGE